MPTWDQFMAPVLKVLADGEVRNLRDTFDAVAQDVGLTDEQRAELLDSGHSRFENRAAWALSYLFRGKLLSRPSRAHYQITDLGQKALKAHPAGITEADLRKLPGFTDPRKHGPAPAQVAPTTPETTLDAVEQVEEGVARIHEEVAADLLNRLHDHEPAFFESAVVDLVVAMGYGGSDTKAVRTQLTNDGGIDGVIDQDVLGLNSVYIQAKRYALDASVLRPEIEGFVGALHGKQARQGVFITTGKFSRGALD